MNKKTMEARATTRRALREEWTGTETLGGLFNALVTGRMSSSRPPAISCRVSLGRFLATPGLLAVVPHDDLLGALARHAAGDWGLVDPGDASANDDALSHGGRILSVYETSQGLRFWLITEADRSSTTALLPDEY